MIETADQFMQWLKSTFGEDLSKADIGDLEIALGNFLQYNEPTNPTEWKKRAEAVKFVSDKLCEMYRTPYEDISFQQFSWIVGTFGGTLTHERHRFICDAESFSVIYYPHTPYKAWAIRNHPDTWYKSNTFEAVARLAQILS